MGNARLHSADELRRRYHAWAKTKPKYSREVSEREALWNSYCDARDGLEDGATANREYSTPDDRQLTLFSERRRVM